MKAQTTAIIASAVVLVMVLASVSSVTYSWFSDSDDTDITVTTGIVDVEGVLSTTWDNSKSGDVKVDLTTDPIKVTGLVADRIINFNYEVTNNSSVDVVYRVILTAEFTNGTGVGIAVAGENFDSGNKRIISYLNLGEESGAKWPYTSDTTDNVFRLGFSLATTDAFTAASLEGNLNINVKVEAYQSDYVFTPVDITNSTLGDGIEAGKAEIDDNATGSIVINGAPKVSDASTPKVTNVNIKLPASLTETIKGGTVTATEVTDTSGFEAKIGNDVIGAVNYTIKDKSSNLVSDLGGVATVSMTLPGNYPAVDIHYIGDSTVEKMNVTSIEYDGTNTIVTFVTTHFSIYVASATPIASIDDVNYIDSGDFFDGLKKAIGVKGANVNVVVMQDFTMGGLVVPAGNNVNLTIDLNGNTLTIGSTVGSVGTETLGMQLNRGNTVTIMDGTIVSPIAKFLINNYCDLTLDDVILDMSDNETLTIDGKEWISGQMVLSNNNGNTTITGETNIIARDGYDAFDVYYYFDGGYKDGVTVIFDDEFTGNVVGKVSMDYGGNPDDYNAKAKLSINGQGDFSKASFTLAENSNITINGNAYRMEENVLTIYDSVMLGIFRDSVNSGNGYKGMTVKLANDIDLNDKEWTPIGNSTHIFQGTFDGNNHKISNLVITGYKSNVGLFGYTTDGEIKNLTVENAKVSGRFNVGVVAGTPYTSKYTNITVTGHVEVNGMSYVGGVGGKNAYADWSDITVNVDETSYVNANSVENGTAYRTYVGGVIGFMGEGGHSFTAVTSNIDVEGSTIDVGGITGIAHYGNEFINCKSSGDVTITNALEAADAEEIGGIAGVWHNGGSNVIFEGCSFTGKLSANITEGVDLSDNNITGKSYSATGPGSLIIQ